MDAIDVVIPTKDRRDMAIRAVRNVLAQHGVDTRCIVVDDGSTDGTSAALSALGDPRIVLLRNEEPRGPATARNQGIASAQARWIAFLDDDDRWAPDKLAAQLEALRRSGRAWAACGCVNIDGSGRVIGGCRLADGGGGDVFDRLLDECVIPAGCSNVLVDHALLDETGGFDQGMPTVEDWPLWLELARRSSLAYVDRPLVAYRNWSGARSGDLDAMGIARRHIRARYVIERQRVGLPRSDPRWDQHLARWAVREGHRFTAARHYLTATIKARRPGQLAYAAASIVAPAIVLHRLDAMDLDAMPIGWREQADTWLAHSDL